MAMTGKERSKAFRERVKNGYIPKKINRKGEGLSKKELYYKNTYGLSEQDYQHMYDRQKGCCAICGTFQEKLFVDHDHNSEEVRSLLCPQCNFGLGSFSDRPDLLRKAAIYILDHEILIQTRRVLGIQ